MDHVNEYKRLNQQQQQQQQPLQQQQGGAPQQYQQQQQQPQQQFQQQHNGGGAAGAGQENPTGQQDAAALAAMVANSKKKEVEISAATKDRVEAAKSYIERKYAKALQSDREFKENWELLQKKMACMNLNNVDKKIIERDVMKQEFESSRKKRQKLSPSDYEPLSIIGRGAFGEVRVCKEKKTDKIVAIKKMKKQEMLTKNQINHVRAERDILAAYGNPWIVDLFCSFQDSKHLYLVMEYLSGGDLMTVLMKKDILSEEESKFYASELVLAIDSVHKMNYIHRDLKPDNILLGRDGHIKLSDFGLSKHSEIRPKLMLGGKDESKADYLKDPTQLLTKRSEIYKRNRNLVFSTVGTPDYIAPEVFGQQGYTEIVDWWSFGVILFEMLVGYPPFFSDEPQQTCQKIINWRKTFGIPKEAGLSQAAEDLIKRLVNDSSCRLGINGVNEIKAHPFFFGVDWNRLREKRPPYVPEVKNDLDVSNFDRFDEEDPWIQQENTKKSKNRQQNFPFIGFTYKKNMESERSPIRRYIDELDQSYANQNNGKPTNQGPSQAQPLRNPNQQSSKSPNHFTKPSESNASDQHEFDDKQNNITIPKFQQSTSSQAVKSASQQNPIAPRQSQQQQQQQQQNLQQQQQQQQQQQLFQQQQQQQLSQVKGYPVMNTQSMVPGSSSAKNIKANLEQNVASIPTYQARLSTSPPQQQGHLAPQQQQSGGSPRSPLSNAQTGNATNFTSKLPSTNKLGSEQGYGTHSNLSGSTSGSSIRQPQHQQYLYKNNIPQQQQGNGTAQIQQQTSFSQRTNANLNSQYASTNLASSTLSNTNYLAQSQSSGMQGSTVVKSNNTNNQANFLTQQQQQSQLLNSKIGVAGNHSYMPNQSLLQQQQTQLQQQQQQQQFHQLQMSSQNRTNGSPRPHPENNLNSQNLNGGGVSLKAGIPASLQTNLGYNFFNRGGSPNNKN